MKVLHLVSGPLSRGAAKGALSLHEGLLAIGVDSYIAAAEDSLLENLISTVSFKNKLRYYINRKYNALVLIGYKEKKGTAFSVGNSPFNCYSDINFSDFDIVNLHWINHSISIDAIKKIKQQAKVVWTMRDMWPFTGGCHYSMTCGNYLNGCGSCEYLGSKNSNDISRKYLAEKKNAYLDIDFIAISKWLAREAVKSGIVSSKKLRTIYNCVDDEVFKQISIGPETSNAFSIWTNRRIVLVGAQNISAPYKGPVRIREFVRSFRKKFHFVFFGAGAKEVLSGIEEVSYTDVGMATTEELCLLYNISDLFLMFSFQEAFGKTLVESLLCGTPVLVLPGSAPAEIINGLPSGCGAVWDGLTDVSGLIDGLLDSHVPVESVMANFSKRVIAEKYSEFYSELMQE